MKHEEVVYRAVQEGILSIDSEGRVWRIANRGGFASHPGGVIVPRKEPKRAESLAPNGYLNVGVRFHPTSYSTGAHRLVYLHFFGEIPDDKTINHKDGNKANNHPDNLEAITPVEQMKHARAKLGFDQDGERNDMAKLTREQVVEIRKKRAAGMSYPKIAAEYGVSTGEVADIAKGTHWKSVKEGPIAENLHDCCGEHQWQAKLTNEKVIEMRRRAKAGETHKVIAEDFGVSRETASRAIRGESWKCVK